jgi:protein-S-isoprenylcysteine O-methyltransferase Ste14
MSDDVAHKKWWQIFEVVFGIPFLVAIVLQRVVSISFPREFLMPAFIPTGSFLIVVGVSLAILARREFARDGQPTDPGLSTSKIITTGVFSVSRNPLYLGGIFILAGISLAFNLPWVLIFLIPSIVTCHYTLIVPEESYLLAKFGEQYQAYATAVHRWIGRK